MDESNDDGGATALVMHCAYAVLSGQTKVAISTRGKRPAGWPRGELLSVGTDGSRNYAVQPVRLLAWLHARTSRPPTTADEAQPAAG